MHTPTEMEGGEREREWEREGEVAIETAVKLSIILLGSLCRSNINIALLLAGNPPLPGSFKV